MSGADRLDGRVALVTGAARGIGRAIAAELHRRGAGVAVNVRDRARAEAAARSLGGDALAAPGDIARAEDVARIVAAVLDRWGRIDILVNNAAYATGTAITDLDEAEWRQAFDVNVTGAFLCLKAVLPAMTRARYGRIVNIGSTASKTVSTLGGAHYTASKHALVGLTKAAARELGPLGITVNAVCPGMTDTELIRQVADAERVKTIVSTVVPIRRLGRPEEVADLVAYLAAERSGYINGSALDIHGGIISA